MLMLNYPIPIKLSINKDQLPDKKSAREAQDQINKLFFHYPYLLNTVKVYWEGRSLSWRQKRMYTSYPFQERKHQDGKSGLVWNEIVLFILPLQLALLRNGLNTFQIQKSEVSSSLVYLSYGSLVGHYVSAIKIQDPGYAWRLFFNNEEDLLYACIVCSKSEVEKAKEEYRELNASIEQHMSEEYSIEQGDYLLNAVNNLQNSTFSQWMATTFGRQLHSLEELTDIIDHCYDEIKETRIAARCYHEIFRWFGEATQQIGYTAYENFARDRNGAKAWGQAIKQHLDELGLPESVADAIFFNHINQILKFQ